MTVQQYYAYLAELNREDREMSDYEKGRRDCEAGILHEHKSEQYTLGYSEQYAKEQEQ